MELLIMDQAEVEPVVIVLHFLEEQKLNLQDIGSFSTPITVGGGGTGGSGGGLLQVHLFLKEFQEAPSIFSTITSAGGGAGGATDGVPSSW